jgi:DNA-binding transcriptional LysR family regulator
MQKGNAKQQPRLPSLDLLKGFEAAARLLSFTKAGEELYLSQSAVSRQIQELEEQLGVSLFQRRHRALALTEAGQTLYAAAAQALATMRAVTDRLRAGRGRQTLAVTTTQILRLALADPAPGRLHAQAPGAGRAHQRRYARAGPGARRPGPRHPPRPGHHGRRTCLRLFGERVFPVCSPKLMKDKKKPLREPRTCATTCCCSTTTRRPPSLDALEDLAGSRSGSPTCARPAAWCSRATTRSSRPRSPATASRSAAARWCASCSPRANWSRPSSAAPIPRAPTTPSCRRIPRPARSADFVAWLKEEAVQEPK